MRRYWDKIQDEWVYEQEEDNHNDELHDDVTDQPIPHTCEECNCATHESIVELCMCTQPFSRWH